MKQNQFEWEVYSPITRRRNIFKLCILALTMCFAMFVSSFAGSSYKAQKVAPNPAKEYPQENTFIIDVKNLPGKHIKNMEKDELHNFMSQVACCATLRSKDPTSKAAQRCVLQTLPL